MTFDEIIKDRADGLKKALKKDNPELSIEQAHLIKGTPERSYWHYGYMVALYDVLRLLDKELKTLTNSYTH